MGLTLTIGLAADGSFVATCRSIRMHDPEGSE